jgi:cyanophycinase
MRGLLMPIGGAEDKYAACEILSRFVKICGGNAANILIIPSASSIPYDVAAEYEYLFYLLGVAQVNSLHISSRQEADDPASLAMLDKATGLFISGGDQLKLSSLIGETRLSAAIHERFLEGMSIGGTSAGASIMSREMIAFGRDKFNPSERLIHIDKGLGLSQKLIIDQHFSQRERLERLKAAVAQNPDLTGVGIDENTALIISPDDAWEIIGAGTVTVVNWLDEARLLQPAVHEKRAERYNQTAKMEFTAHPLASYQASPD